MVEQPMRGKDLFYIVQDIDAVEGEDALLVAFQTEGTFSSENELMDEQTKFGRVLAYGNDSESFELTYYKKRGDEGQDVIADAKKNKKQLKVWEVDATENGDGNHDARFAYALVESLESSNASDGFVEMSTTLPIIGTSQEGEITALPQDTLDALKAMQYEFEEPGDTGTTAT